MNYDKIVEKFEESASKNGIYLEEGNSKKADIEMRKIWKLYQELKSCQKIDLLVPLLSSPNKFVQLYASMYLLQFDLYKDDCESLLNQMIEEMNSPGEYGTYALTASLIMNDWKKNGELGCF